VDPDELEEFGALADVTMPLTFYYKSEGGKNRFAKFVDDCGLDSQDGRSIRHYVEELSGKTVMVVCKHEISQDQQSTRAKLDGTLKPE
jgi:hypothetical protein